MNTKYNKKPHKYAVLETVEYMHENESKTGYICSRLHKLPKGAKVEEPYYIISGHGPAVWEGNIIKAV